jgi:hypothetical protein
MQTEHSVPSDIAHRASRQSVGLDGVGAGKIQEMAGRHEKLPSGKPMYAVGVLHAPRLID